MYTFNFENKLFFAQKDREIAKIIAKFKNYSYLCNMKTATGILLSIYTVMLSISFSPGVHIFENHENCHQTEQHACCGADSHDVCCTLFRTCNICTGTGFIVEKNIELDIKTSDISTKNADYRQPIYLSPYIKGILQPPKF